VRSVPQFMQNLAPWVSSLPQSGQNRVILHAPQQAEHDGVPGV
jgi:hypothetical protein